MKANLGEPRILVIDLLCNRDFQNLLFICELAPPPPPEEEEEEGEITLGGDEYETFGLLLKLWVEYKPDFTGEGLK